MEKIYIIAIDDQPEVLQAVSKDLEFFESAFNIEECESAEEAYRLMNSILDKGDYVGLILSDHVMPYKTGIQFLIDLRSDLRFADTRKVLLTALATHHDTIEAINKASIHGYIEKPWKPEELATLVRKQITSFILHKGIEYQPYIPLLDSTTLFAGFRNSSE
jgi:two-component system chemotaxis response regulator CheY